MPNGHRGENRENTMKKSTRCVAASFAIGGAFAFAPIATANDDDETAPDTGPYPTYQFGYGPSPLVPYGSTPYSPYQFGYINVNHDEVYTTNGYLDVPF
jgi:hypothetical protein